MTAVASSTNQLNIDIYNIDAVNRVDTILDNTVACNTGFKTINGLSKIIKNLDDNFFGFLDGNVFVFCKNNKSYDSLMDQLKACTVFTQNKNIVLPENKTKFWHNTGKQVTFINVLNTGDQLRGLSAGLCLFLDEGNALKCYKEDITYYEWSIILYCLKKETRFCKMD